ncbi:MAG: hypothetical protein ACYSUK_10280, partial [Planctomycetota bacterium]
GEFGGVHSCGSGGYGNLGSGCSCGFSLGGDFGGCGGGGSGGSGGSGNNYGLFDLGDVHNVQQPV